MLVLTLYLLLVSQSPLTHSGSSASLLHFWIQVTLQQTMSTKLQNTNDMLKLQVYGVCVCVCVCVSMKAMVAMSNKIVTMQVKI